MKKNEDIKKEADAIKCPVKSALHYVKEFLAGPMCGKCFPCSMGMYEARLRIEDISSGSGTEEDISSLENIGDMVFKTGMCKKGKDAAAYLTEKLKNKQFAEHIAGVCAELECEAYFEYRNVKENCINCGLCKDACKYDAILGEKKITMKCCVLPFEIRQKRCVKCGECIKVCPSGAIIKVNIGEKIAVKS